MQAVLMTITTSTRGNPKSKGGRADVYIEHKIGLAQTQHAIHTIGDDTETDNYGQ